MHAHAPTPLSARCAIVTLSDTRTIDTDKSGRQIRALLTAAGHTVADYHLIKDDSATLDALLTALLGRGDVDVIVTNGGTGISPRDHTIPVIDRHLAIPLPGFGELFRALSHADIGPAAMLSRATGGIAGPGRDKLLFALPGSTKAVTLALEKLLLPELSHLLHELRKA